MSTSDATADLLDFLRACPTAFHTAAEVSRRLDAAGFTRLDEAEAWHLEPGGRYYVTRNASSVVALKVGSELDAYHFQMAAAHGDSPTYKLKPVSELEGPDGYLRLDVEPYGGLLDYTWLDRPLGLAGRVLVAEGDRVESRLVHLDRDLSLIPSLAVHLDRGRGLAPELSRAVDQVPVISAGELGTGALDRMVAEAAGARPEDVLGSDLYLVVRDEPRVWGEAGEFVSGGHLDDLQNVHAALEALLAAENPHDVSVLACFDNEEVGSGTKQGARSTFLSDVLSRASEALGRSREEHLRALAGSMLVSCDSAHATHPSHPELHDPVNRCRLNGGLVIKETASQRYCTDGFSRAAMIAILRRAGVPYQVFANRSDRRGGSTLGNLSNAQVSVHAVDVGLPLLAMHSAYETAGARDTELGIAGLRAFYETNVLIDGARGVELA